MTSSLAPRHGRLYQRMASDAAALEPRPTCFTPGAGRCNVTPAELSHPNRAASHQAMSWRPVWSQRPS